MEAQSYRRQRRRNMAHLAKSAALLDRRANATSRRIPLRYETQSTQQRFPARIGMQWIEWR